MPSQHNPKSANAVIYSDEELYDFANSGGSVTALLDEELGEGNRFIIVRQPIDGRAAVVVMLERPEDISRWEDYCEKMRNWREQILGNLPIDKNVTPPSMPHAQGAHQMRRGSSPKNAP